jgi:hypothetical protein
MQTALITLGGNMLTKFQKLILSNKHKCIRVLRHNWNGKDSYGYLYDTMLNEHGVPLGVFISDDGYINTDLLSSFEFIK